MKCFAEGFFPQLNSLRIRHGELRAGFAIIYGIIMWEYAAVESTSDIGVIRVRVELMGVPYQVIIVAWSEELRRVARLV